METRRVSFEGTLEKTSGVFKNKTKVWMVVQDLSLTYYKNNKRSSCIGSIDMTTVQSVTQKKTIGGGKKFEIITATNSYLFEAETSELCEAWVKVLQQAMALKSESSGSESATSRDKDSSSVTPGDPFPPDSETERTPSTTVYDELETIPPSPTVFGVKLRPTRRSRKSNNSTSDMTDSAKTGSLASPISPPPLVLHADKPKSNFTFPSIAKNTKLELEKGQDSYSASKSPAQADKTKSKFSLNPFTQRRKKHEEDNAPDNTHAKETQAVWYDTKSYDKHGDDSTLPLDVLKKVDDTDAEIGLAQCSKIDGNSVTRVPATPATGDTERKQAGHEIYNSADNGNHKIEEAEIRKPTETNIEINTPAISATEPANKLFLMNENMDVLKCEKLGGDEKTVGKIQTENSSVMQEADEFEQKVQYANDDTRQNRNSVNDCNSSVDDRSSIISNSGTLSSSGVLQNEETVAQNAAFEMALIDSENAVVHCEKEKLENMISNLCQIETQTSTILVDDIEDKENMNSNGNQGMRSTASPSLVYTNDALTEVEIVSDVKSVPDENAYETNHHLKTENAGTLNEGHGKEQNGGTITEKTGSPSTEHAEFKTEVGKDIDAIQMQEVENKTLIMEVHNDKDIAPSIVKEDNDEEIIASQSLQRDSKVNQNDNVSQVQMRNINAVRNGSVNDNFDDIDLSQVEMRKSSRNSRNRSMGSCRTDSEHTIQTTSSETETRHADVSANLERLKSLKESLSIADNEDTIAISDNLEDADANKTEMACLEKKESRKLDNLNLLCTNGDIDESILSEVVSSAELKQAHVSLDAYQKLRAFITQHDATYDVEFHRKSTEFPVTALQDMLSTMK